MREAVLVTVVEEETLREETLEEEIIEDLTSVETEMEVTDSEEEVGPDLALQQAITEVHQESTMTSEDHQEETDLDLVAEMDLLTVENGIEMITDILSEGAWSIMEVEAQTESRVAEQKAEDQTITLEMMLQSTTEEASSQILSLTVIELRTEESEEVVAMTTMTDAQWTTVAKETDSKEEVTAAQTASKEIPTAEIERESTTVTASTAIKRVTSPSTAVFHRDQEVNMEVVIEADTVAVVAEATTTIGRIDKTTSTVSEPKQNIAIKSFLIPHLRYEF